MSFHGKEETVGSALRSLLWLLVPRPVSRAILGLQDALVLSPDRRELRCQCSGCKTSLHGGPFRNLAEARVYATAFGWSYGDQHGDGEWCPRCTEARGLRSLAAEQVLGEMPRTPYPSEDE